MREQKKDSCKYKIIAYLAFEIQVIIFFKIYVIVIFQIFSWIASKKRAHYKISAFWQLISLYYTQNQTSQKPETQCFRYRRFCQFFM